jgi:predicted ATPase
MAERMLALSTKHQFWVGDIAIILLSIDAQPGKHELDDLHSRLKASARVPNLHRAFLLCLLAELYGKAGHAGDGLALMASIPTEDRGGFYAPEIHRLEGELRRRLPSPDIIEIERCFQAALVIARQHAAKSLELRAATSLARLWRDQERRAEARELLEPISDWFTEGLDLPDLKNARELLDELTRASLVQKRL